MFYTRLRSLGLPWPPGGCRRTFSHLVIRACHVFFPHVECVFQMFVANTDIGIFYSACHARGVRASVLVLSTQGCRRSFVKAAAWGMPKYLRHSSTFEKNTIEYHRLASNRFGLAVMAAIFRRRHFYMRICGCRDAVKTAAHRAVLYHTTRRAQGNVVHSHPERTKPHWQTFRLGWRIARQ